ncbi:uncharacterized protein B0J16DRAFT_182980 [Fusarium flagelliforme]|uniref:Uncharacterized protein n=1 Tax=Fusarium flagelliforme TaxID=2675880 RepID=A0A395MJ12_9HYPO|nr:uncharacterized protein B0J16DRAFT_182980 [Fusarium flagelliforme]KAH7174551.1 hypothetical protein B0J16DRAFT_182980 [Fusarium flagelliforme]RFN47740.1 hypothetical protein FIE12Z_8014 [Fusarium flagelliforme]
MLEPRNLTEAKRSKIYWEEICLPPSQTTPQMASKKPSSSGPVITLTEADLDRVKKLISPPVTPSENLEVPEELAKLEDEQYLWRYDPMTWTLRYCTDLMEEPENTAPEILPPSLRLVHVRSDAPYNIRNPAALPPIPEGKATDAPQELSHEKQFRANRANSIEGNEPLNPHYESDAVLRESRNQIARVDQTNDKIKEYIADLRRRFEAFRAKQKWP